MTLLTPTSSQQEPSPNRVERVDGERRLPVLSRLLGRDRDHALRFLRFAASEGLTLDWLWAAFGRDERVEAALLLSPGPGRTAMLTISPLRGWEEEAAGVEVVHAALREASSLDVALVQSLLEPRNTAEAGVLCRAGLRPLATLNYMERTLPRASRAPAAATAPPRLPEGVSLNAYDDGANARRMLAELLVRTYEDTLDCPGLSGLRTPSDVLDGHRRGGRFDPSLWSLLMLRGRPVGVLLLNAATHAAGLELVYLGLVPEVRGRGLGRVLIDRALGVAQSRGDRAVMLAVDEENAPALRLYRAAGFKRTARRCAFLAPIDR